MGSNKLLADLGGKPVIAHVADAVRAAGLPALAVLGHEPDAVRAALGPIDCIIAHDHAEGIARSIAAGIAAIDWGAAILCLGDMPRISPQLLRLLADEASSNAILVPAHAGRRGNPVTWGCQYFAELIQLRGDTGGRALFANHDITEIPWTDDDIFADVDTPEALASIRHDIDLGVRAP